MSTYFRDKQLKAFRQEAQAFRNRAEINDAYVHLKVEHEKLIEATDNNTEPEHYINSDLSALVVELSNTIAKLSKRNANLQKENRELKTTNESFKSQLMWWNGTSCHEHPHP